MKRHLPFYLMILLVSCEDKDWDIASNPIDSKIIIEAREILEPNSRRLTLACRTERIYPCINFPILREVQTVDHSIKIDFTSVVQLDMCFTAPGPARAEVDLAALPHGEYDLELNNANLKNHGTLKITDTDITFQFDSKNGIAFERTNTKRVPPNTYWGTIGYHAASSEAMVDNFIEKFADLGAEFNQQQPGHYFYYEIDDSGEMTIDVENSGYYFAKAFIFQFDGDEAELKELIQGEGQHLNQTFSVNLSNYKGENFYNWGN